MSGSTPAQRILWSSLVVVGLLAIPFFFASRSTLHSAYLKRAAADMHMLLGALDDFAARHGEHYPARLVELFGADARDNPYLVKFGLRMPLDGWGHEYGYAPPAEGHPHPRLFCYGADGKPGGSGADADVDSDTLRDDW